MKIWSNLDKALCKKFKKLLYLPDHASVNYLYGHQQDGLFGIAITGEDSDIAHIDSAYKLLTSPDDIVRETAWAELRTHVET